MQKTWKVHENDVRVQNILCDGLGISPIFAQLLINRGIRTPETAQVFLFGNISDCADPFLMKDMERSVARIRKAVANREKILIYGDYDVDGVTSTALLAHVFGYLKADFDTFIPNRLEDGYGLNLRAVALAREQGVDLIITVDCGINSFKEIKCANDYGIDVIVTDHHEIKEEELPPAYSIIDAHQKDCKYPYKGLAGVGVAYKLAKALVADEGYHVDEHLDLVALGTIADIAPLTGENRILARAGLESLRKTSKPGLVSLMDIARIKPEKLRCSHIGFVLGPRINAMGRVGSANEALELLLCDDIPEAREIARKLDRENKRRQTIEKELFGEAVSLVGDRPHEGEGNVLVLAGEGWHAGVLGIVASKLTEEYNVPAIMISLDGDRGKGSGRSVDGLNLFESIREASSYLTNFGGHESACGLKIEKKHLPGFREKLDSVIGGKMLDMKKKQPELDIDLNLPFSYLGMGLLKELQLLMPYGAENAEPVFSTNRIMVKNNPRDIGRGGFKFLASCGNLTCEAITFRSKKILKPRRGDMINLAYTPSINSWEGIDTVQLNIKDLQLLS